MLILANGSRNATTPMTEPKAPETLAAEYTRARAAAR
jgi:hypothetical protein